MLPSIVSGLLARELRTLAREVALYPSDAALWQQVPGLPNVGGTLALHLLGNLQHFVGARLGRSGYVRDRDAEFARRDVPRERIVAEVEEAIAAVEGALAAFDDARASATYPDAVGGHRVRTDEWLVHLVSHCAYHLGQLDYHRRAVTGDARGATAMAIPELRSAVKVDDVAPVTGPIAR